MYILMDNILSTVLQKSESLKDITDGLLSKLYSQVWHGDCSEKTYRNVYHAIQDSKNLKELNDALTYEVGYRILINNQL